MKRIRNWIDIIRCDDYFELAAINHRKENIIESPYYGPYAHVYNIPRSHFQETKIRLGYQNVLTEYDTFYLISDIPDDFPGIPPSAFSLTTFFRNSDETGAPHGNSPAPAQRYGNIVFLWGDVKKAMENSHHEAHHIDFHREDGFPASIEVVNLSKHFSHGALHRKGSNPAIKADFIVAHWFKSNRRNRPGGPHTIAVEQYNEYWTGGVYKGFREGNHHLSWDIAGYTLQSDRHGVVTRTPIPKELGNHSYARFNSFMGKLQGETNIYSNQFFVSAEDELCFITEFQ